MTETTALSITPESDVSVLLGRKPFPSPLTHLTVETDTATLDDDYDNPIVTRIVGRRLKVYNGEKLLATTGHFRINITTRVVRLWKKYTVLSQS